MNSETSSSFSDASLPIIKETLPPMHLTRIFSRKPSFNIHLLTRESIPSEAKKASIVLPVELIASRSEAVTSITHHTRMASNTIIKNPERSDGNDISINSSTIYKFDSFEDRPTCHARSPALTSVRPLGYRDEQEEATSSISIPPSSRTFEDTRNVDPLSESYAPPFPAPQNMINGKRDILIGTPTLPAILDFAVTDTIYSDYRLNPSMRWQGVERSHQESDPSEAQHTLYTPETETSSGTSTYDSNLDHPGYESSDSDSIDDKMPEVDRESKAVTKDEASLSSTDQVPQKSFSLSKATWKFPSTYKDVDVSEGEEANIDEPSSSHNQCTKNQKPSNSLETLVSRLPNTTLKIHPVMVLYDSKVNCPAIARVRLSVKRPLSDDMGNEFVKRVRLVNGLNHKK